MVSPVCNRGPEQEKGQGEESRNVSRVTAKRMFPHGSGRNEVPAPVLTTRFVAALIHLRHQRIVPIKTIQIIADHLGFQLNPNAACPQIVGVFLLFIVFREPSSQQIWFCACFRHRLPTSAFVFARPAECPAHCLRLTLGFPAKLLLMRRERPTPSVKSCLLPMLERAYLFQTQQHAPRWKLVAGTERAHIIRRCFI